MLDIYNLMGITKTNPTVYHPQTDGLVERFHRMLTDMLAKSVEKNSKDWDKHLPFVLFAYRSCIQQSTGESPFDLTYGRDLRLLTEEALGVQIDRWLVDIEDYKVELFFRLAQTESEKARGHQKEVHDQKARQPDMQVGLELLCISQL